MRKFLLAGAVLALILIIAGCGGSSDGGTSGTEADTDTGSAEAISELKWASPPIRRADAVSSFDHATLSVVAPVAQGLMSFDKNGKVVPELASAVEQPDDTTYVYKLKDGVKFSDGKPVTAEDVVFSLERSMGEDSQLAANFESVKSIEARGSNEVVVKLKQPDIVWPNVPAFAGQVIQKKAAIAGGVDQLGTPSNLPIGSGPYKFASFSPSTGATLELNPHWTGEEPTVQKVTIKFFADGSTIPLAMRSGEVSGDFFVESQRSFEVPGVQLLSTPGALQTLLSLNTIVPPFDDIHVRKAIAYASNREGIAEAVFDGAAEVNETLTPIALYGSIAPEEEVQEKFAELPKYDFDLAAAKAELAKSKYPDGFSTSVAVEPGAMVKMAQVLAPDLAEIGIDLEIEQLPSSAYLAKLYGPRDKIGAMIDIYGATSPDPSSLMEWWLSPDQAKVNGLNSANYKNAEVGRLLEEQARELDTAGRLQLITDTFRQMKEDVPYIPLVALDQFMVISDDYAFEDYSAWAHFGPWPLQVRQAS